MELLIVLVLVVVALVWYGAVKLSSTDEEPNNPRRSSPPLGGETSSTQSPAGKKQPTVFRPSSSRERKINVVFQPSAPASAARGKTGVSLADQIAGLHDAFTGAPLDTSLGLHQCGKCTVYYHAASFAVLRSENSSQCVSCGSVSIRPVSDDVPRPAAGRDFTPAVVTLANYRSKIGAVVTFQGLVCKVMESRRGSDYAVMFENTTWAKGFKLVFFRGSISACGGKRFIMSLEGKTVRVRGLLINHPRFGYEIVVSERSMILDIA